MDFRVSDNKNDIDFPKLHYFLHYKAYWCIGIPEETIKKSIENSECFSLLNDSEEFCGFARVVTDYATFAYLADVFVLDEYRGKGLSKLLIKYIHNHHKLQNLRTWLLLTKDAQGLYEQFGWINAEGRYVMRNKKIKNFYQINNN